MQTVRRFTGFHATMILVAFFAIVIAVNVLMTSLAVSTFGGTIVDNSYVASQKFNGWLAEARDEEKLGWVIPPPERDDRHHVRVRVADRSGKALQGARIEMHAEHPLGKTPIISGELLEIAPGQYRSSQPLPVGRWKLTLRVTRGHDHFDRSFEILWR